MTFKRNWIIIAIIIALGIVLFLPIFSVHDPVPSSVKQHTNSWFSTFSIKNLHSDKNKGDVCLTIKEAVKAKPVFIAQDDPKLIDYIQDNGLITSPSTKPYNLEKPHIRDTSMGQSAIILNALKNMTNGFFVECGALDGETRSNTLYMEKELGWTGLLIEGDPKNFEKVIEKQRKAYSINSCLAIHPYPHQASFKQAFNVGRITENEDANSKTGSVDVQCFPLFSLLAAMNISTIDYFSLDIEGDEMKVLRNIPFDKLLIKTLSVEYIHGEGENPLEDYMVNIGYRLLGKVTKADGTANDLLFIHRSLDE